MKRNILGILLALGLTGAAGESQAQFIGPGSTPAGDYLRGVGVAAWGMGLYNLNTAQANQIDTKTFIMLNEYLWNVVKNEMKENAEHRAAILRRKAEAYRKIQERVHSRPEPTDVTNAAALNAEMLEMLSPAVSDRVAQKTKIPLAASAIRHIHFQLGEKGDKFSMARLSLKGTKKWAVAFQDPRFASYRRAYERAVDDALELAIDGNMKPEAIRAIRNAVDNLQYKLDHTPELLDPTNQRRYSEAKIQLDHLRLSARLFETLKMQHIFGEIDSYAGTTVDDLRLFMRKHGLTFAPAETPEERALYPQLHAALVEQAEQTIGTR